jgi:hypothetical protein
MGNDGLEKALKETWENKERFYEDTKGLSMREVIEKIETQYRERGDEQGGIVRPFRP